MKTVRRSLFLLLLPLLFSSCGSFHEQWREAMETPPNGIEGAWEGTWLSNMNGHNGKLRGVVTKKSDTEYEFLYWASWGKIFSGSFPAVHTVVPAEDGDGFTLSGTEDLGALGGVYTFEGSIDEEKYEATYKSSRKDHGVFEMTRPERALTGP